MTSHEATVVLTGLQPGLTYSFEVAIIIALAYISNVQTSLLLQIKASTSIGFSEGITVTYTLPDKVDGNNYTLILTDHK